MVKTEAPVHAQAASNSYSLHLPLVRLSSTLQLHLVHHRARASIPLGPSCNRLSGLFHYEIRRLGRPRPLFNFL